MQSTQSEPYQTKTILTAENVSYTYNTQKNRLLSAGTASFNYDNEGQLNTGYGSNYSFDYEHRLITIGSSSQFQYDGKGNRLQAVRNDITTRYIYDAAGNLLAEADGNNNITRYYIYGKGLLAMVTPQDQTYCYHYNATGSTIALTDMGQNIVNAYAYDPFGNILNQQETTAQSFKFVGQFGIMTEPNGFYYMRARYYDPNVGRFISEDPIGFSGGDVNFMVYVGNNPVMGVDPEGFWPLGAPESGFNFLGFPVPSRQSLTSQLQNALYQSGFFKTKEQANKTASNIVAEVGWSDLGVAKSIVDSLNNGTPLTKDQKTDAQNFINRLPASDQQPLVQLLNGSSSSSGSGGCRRRQ